MYVDSQTEFSDSQAVTATAISTNVVDLLSTGLGAGSNVGSNLLFDIEDSSALALVVQTATACSDVGSDATLTVSIESADDVGLSTNKITHFTSGAIPFVAFSPAGARVLMARLPAGQYRRFLGLRFSIANGPLTAGAFDAFLTPAKQANRIFRTSVPLVQ